MEQNDIASRIVFADRGKVNVEKGVEFAPKFDQNGLIPALAMDHVTHEPLMLAYMNAESLRMTMELGEAVYYSRSRQEIWHKGATSGHVQKVKQILIDCDQDALRAGGPVRRRSLPYRAPLLFLPFRPVWRRTESPAPGAARYPAGSGRRRGF